MYAISINLKNDRKACKGYAVQSPTISIAATNEFLLLHQRPSEVVNDWVAESG